MRVLRKALVAVLSLGLFLWMASVGYLWLNESKYVFRSEFSRRNSFALDPAFTSLELRTAEGIRLDAVTLSWAEAAERRHWIIYFQGNAGSLRRSRVQGQLRSLHGLGYHVLSFDYRGYGRSDGAPTEAGLYDDALTAYHHLIRRGVNESRILLVGQSLGSAVAVELATRVPVAGLVLFSPLDSVPETAGRLYPWVPAGLIATNRFDSMAKVGRLTMPVLVFHSDTDRLIPIDAARALVARVKAPKRLFQTAGGHNGAGFAEPAVLRSGFETFWPTEALMTAADHQ